mmetsp:Transcript_13005/g.40390  ORF Transcript_13005/g.40390 Transcript_13005/m.40390 type:complete len:296 (+) Transcript_13005:380-1267(+)
MRMLTRPGRSRALSSFSGWLVVMTRMRPGASTTPSSTLRRPARSSLSGSSHREPDFFFFPPLAFFLPPSSSSSSSPSASSSAASPPWDLLFWAFLPLPSASPSASSSSASSLSCLVKLREIASESWRVMVDSSTSSSFFLLFLPGDGSEPSPSPRECTTFDAASTSSSRKTTSLILCFVASPLPPSSSSSLSPPPPPPPVLCGNTWSNITSMSSWLVRMRESGTEMMWRFVCAAMALTSDVLPVPGGPWSSSPSLCGKPLIANLPLRSSKCCRMLSTLSRSGKKMLLNVFSPERR